MLDKLKEIPAKALEWWKKFSTKQKALMISVVAVVAVALAILGVVLSTPKMVVLKECENAKEASQVKNLLDENTDIQYEVSSDGLVFKVRQQDEATATLLLAENSITPDGYEWDNLDEVFSGGFSSTEADKNKKYQLYKEQQLEDDLESLDAIENAQVTLKMAEDDGTLIARNEESYAWVVLELNTKLEETMAQGLGRAVATAIGNDTTDRITILDTKGNTLFAGGESDTSTGTANSNLEVKSKAEAAVAEQVRDVVMETQMYDSVSVAPNLDIDYTESTVTDQEVYLGEGLDEPLPSSKREYESNSQGGVAGVPGTDSNDANTYVTEDESYTESTITEKETEYQNSQRITNETTTMGKPNYEESSLAVVASRIHMYNEKDMRASGQLDGMTFDEFVEANSENVRLEVDQDLITMVSNATGIPEDNVSMIAYEVPMFAYADEEGKDFMDYLPIVIAALIMLMLGYVVFRSTRKEQEPIQEPELSVEALLESTREAQEDLEDIGFSEKSETRVLIEKFVDENPEAAASLLRNWLNEEWE